MTSSETELVNSALIKIGHTRQITNLNEDSLAARSAKELYPKLRDRLLRRYRWNFAIKRANLSTDAEATPVHGFNSAFAQPDDMLRMIGIYDEFEPEENYVSTRHVWKAEGQHIAANHSAPLPVTYIRRVENVKEFDPAFVEALTWLLASQLAYPLSLGADIATFAKNEFTDAMNEARLADAVEGWPEIQRTDSWVDSRQQFGATGEIGFGPRRFP